MRKVQHFHAGQLTLSEMPPSQNAFIHKQPEALTGVSPGAGQRAVQMGGGLAHENPFLGLQSDE